MIARWGGATIFLHWLGAGLVLFLLAEGWIMVHAGLGAASAFDLYQLHKSLGFLALATLAPRLLARALWAAPAPLASLARWEVLAASATHRALYALMLIAGLSGWLVVSSATIAIPTRFFGWFVIPNLGAANEAAFAWWSLAHSAIAAGIAGLATLHAGAALKHHFWDRDAVLARMLPWRRDRSHELPIP